MPVGWNIKRLRAIITPLKKELVNLLFSESSKVAQKTKRDIEEEIRTQYLTDYDGERLKCKEQYHCYEKK